MVTKDEYEKWLNPKNLTTAALYADKLDKYDPSKYRKKGGTLFSEVDALNLPGSLFGYLDTVKKIDAFRNAMGSGYESLNGQGVWSNNNHLLSSALTQLKSMMTGETIRDDSNEEVEEMMNRNQVMKDLPRNVLYFGAPGTGKSYKMNKEGEKRFEGRVERVTFYADYLHSQFVGSYKPVSDGENIRYEFQPGPFVRVLVNALKHPDQEYGLIIEELNRAEAASVFGDLFQLLDRDGNGVSQYPVSVNEDLKRYLKNALKDNGFKILAELVCGTNGSEGFDCGAIVIPSNMYIWATMNSADQGVFPLDTAFKRRWTFKYFGINDNESGLDAKDENTKNWKAMRKAINGKLIEKGVNEDKCMGPFFLNEQEREASFDEAFKNKVIMYLYEDAARYLRDAFFENGKTLGDLFRTWDNAKPKSIEASFKAVFGERIKVEWPAGDQTTVEKDDDSHEDESEGEQSEETMEE